MPSPQATPGYQEVKTWDSRLEANRIHKVSDDEAVESVKDLLEIGQLFWHVANYLIRFSVRVSGSNLLIITSPVTLTLLAARFRLVRFFQTVEKQHGEQSGAEGAIRRSSFKRIVKLQCRGL